VVEETSNTIMSLSKSQSQTFFFYKKNSAYLLKSLFLLMIRIRILWILAKFDNSFHQGFIRIMVILWFLAMEDSIK
jgi:hypothetical protein